MQEDLSSYRTSYQKDTLLEKNIPKCPLALFRQWFHDADISEDIAEPNAMTIATIGVDKYPKNRVVLLKKYTDEGFIFFTNYNSEKGKAIAMNPKVCLSFFWQPLERQIIIKGSAEKTPEALSDSYFKSRPYGSKLSALASDQSQIIASRDMLENKLSALELYYAAQEVPRPDYWGGYIVKPSSLEFWQGRPNRLHDRIYYTLDENSDWKIRRLAP